MIPPTDRENGALHITMPDSQLFCRFPEIPLLLTPRVANRCSWLLASAVSPYCAETMPTATNEETRQSVPPRTRPTRETRKPVNGTLGTRDSLADLASATVAACAGAASVTHHRRSETRKRRHACGVGESGLASQASAGITKSAARAVGIDAWCDGALDRLMAAGTMICRSPGDSCVDCGLQPSAEGDISQRCAKLEPVTTRDSRCLLPTWRSAGRRACRDRRHPLRCRLRGSPAC